MTDTKFACSVCGTVFSEHRAIAKPVAPEEDQIMCPKCGSVELEPYDFDPDGPVDNPLEGPGDEEAYAP